jgi:hypothetical protein
MYLADGSASALHRGEWSLGYLAGLERAHGLVISGSSRFACYDEQWGYAAPQPQPAGVPQQAQAEVSAVTSQEPYAWTRRRFIEDDRGTPIGMDEPEFSWGAEPPEESGWFPLYAASPSAPAAQPAPQWISVDERMPEPGTEVIVWSPGNAQHGAFVFIDTWREQRECPVDFSTVSVPIGLGWDSSDFDEITHWMPLPAAPSPEGEKSNGE